MLIVVNVYLYALRMHATEIRVKWQIWIKASSLTTTTTTTTRYRWYVLCVLCTIHVNKSASHRQLAYVRFCVCAHVHIRIIFWCRIFRLSRLSLVRGFSVIYYTWFSMKLILMHVIPVPSVTLTIIWKNQNQFANSDGSLCLCHLLQCNMDIVLGVLVFVIRCWMKFWLPFGRNFILANQLIIGLCECFRSFFGLVAFANDLTSGCLNSFIYWLSNYAH